MREIFPNQQILGQTNIEDIVICNSSRDDIPNILSGLQHIYSNKEVLNQICLLLKNIFSESQVAFGRAGMDIWSIFVLATLRVNLNWDYDRLREMANNHIQIRQMLCRGGILDDGYKYPLQTIKDNVHLLTPEVMEKINKVVVDAGHKLLKKKMLVT
jgi:hypothetical protein